MLTLADPPDDTTALLAGFIAIARAVIAAAPSPLGGLVNLAKMGLAGTRTLRDAAYTRHVIVEGTDGAVVRSKLKRLRQLTAPGWPIASTVATVVRATPFAPTFNVLGPSGERWVPLHGVLPHSRVPAFHEALGAVYRNRAEDMRPLGVWTGGMFETVTASGFLYEIALNGAHGAVRFQLGKIYPYATVLEPGALALIRAVKEALDPKGLMNPGVLGL